MNFSHWHQSDDRPYHCNCRFISLPTPDLLLEINAFASDEHKGHKRSGGEHVFRQQHSINNSTGLPHHFDACSQSIKRGWWFHQSCQLKWMIRWTMRTNIVNCNHDKQQSTRGLWPQHHGNMRGSTACAVSCYRGSSIDNSIHHAADQQAVTLHQLLNERMMWYWVQSWQRIMRKWWHRMRHLSLCGKR